MSIENGGPAFPFTTKITPMRQDETGFVRIATDGSYTELTHSGMALRDYFAAHVQADDRLVKAVRAMDDTALAMFAIFPESEREEWITEVEAATEYMGLSDIERIVKRLEVEAKAIARVRYMQADAMLKARGQS